MDGWVSEADGRVAVLLGAGASVPAGLPLSSQLTEEVRSALDGDDELGLVWAALEETIDLNILDVEQLYREIGLIQRLLASGLDASRLDFRKEITTGAISLVKRHLLYAVTSALRKKQRNASVEYFEPLVRARALGIVTLNFDTLVERAAERFSVDLSTGADEWDGGFTWPDLPGKSSLLKLHGSLNWYQELRENRPLPLMQLRVLREDEEYRWGGAGVFSDLRFGDANKLTQEGPTSALMSAFSRLLGKAEVVVAVGYSFRDAHVDSMLYRWAALETSRRLIIVDPCRDEENLELLEKSLTGPAAAMVAGMRHDNSLHRAQRLKVVSLSADEAFGELFN